MADLHSCNADQFVTDLAEWLAKQKSPSPITKEMGPDISLLGLAAGRPVGSWSGLPSRVFGTQIGQSLRRPMVDDRFFGDSVMR